MRIKPFDGKSDEELVREICNDDLSEDQMQTRMSVLVSRHLDDLEYGLRTVWQPDNWLWQRACENLGVDTPKSLVGKAVNYLLHIPEKGENQGIRRICRYLDDSRSFGDCISRILWGLARRVRREINEEIDHIEENEDIDDLTTDHTLTASPGSSTSSRYQTGRDISDHDRPLERVDDPLWVLRGLLGNLDSECEPVVEELVLGNSILDMIKAIGSEDDGDGDKGDKVESFLSRAEKCLLQLARVMKEEDLDLDEFGYSEEKAKLWDCVVELEEPCRSLMFDYCFLDLPYWRIGWLYSDNQRADYDDYESYKRAEYDWARYRIQETYMAQIQEGCSEEALLECFSEEALSD